MAHSCTSQIANSKSVAHQFQILQRKYKTCCSYIYIIFCKYILIILITAYLLYVVNIFQSVKNTEPPSGNCIAKYGTRGTIVQPYLMYCKVWNLWHNHLHLHNVMQSKETVAQPHIYIMYCKLWNMWHNHIPLPKA